MPNRVLVTRPAAQAQATEARLRALGFEPVLAPSLVIEPRACVAPPRVQAVLVSSANAIPALPATLRSLPLLAVGDATAAHASEAGFTDVTSAGRDAAALAELAKSRLDPHAGPILLAVGARQGGALAASLRGAGFRVVRRVAYAARPTRTLPEAARAALLRGEVGHVLFFSPASAAASVRLLRGLPTDAITALAISAATAAALSPLKRAPLKWADIRVASSPDQEALLALLPRRPGKAR